MGGLALGYSFVFIFLLVLSGFLGGLGLMVLLGLSLVLVWSFSEAGNSASSSAVRYPFAFWLFILGEVMIFLSLFTAVLWSDDGFISSISEWEELPFLGCFLLLGSSITATCCHYFWGSFDSKVYLFLSFILGSGFILLQGKEFYDCTCDLLSTVFSAASFCTVGLHFSHVFLGLLAFFCLGMVGLSSVDMIYADYAVWYWHFVDYIWLLVFFIIYYP